MNFEYETIEETLLNIKLKGRMDLQGNQAIELELTSVAASEKSGVIVDMSGVEFLASMGIKTLITMTKAQLSHGGEVVLCSIQPLVKEILTTTGIDTIIKNFDTCDEAIKYLKNKGL